MPDPSADRPLHEHDPDAALVMLMPEIPPGRVRWLYYSGYYDGPISGRVMVDAIEVWAQQFEQCSCLRDEDTDESPCGFYRRYRLIVLEPAVDAEEARRHALFREMVGYHMEIREDGRRSHFDAATHPNWHDFYDLVKGWPEWSPTGVLVGWFQR
jgi:hypothetical protein